MKFLSLVTISLLFASCGKGSGTSSTSSQNSNGSTSTCQIGQVSTSQGCLTSNGTYGYGYGSNGQAVSGSCWSGTTMTQYGCQSNGNSTFGSTTSGTTSSSGGSCQAYAGCSTGVVCYSPYSGYYCD